MNIYDTLKILKEERDYEDRLAQNIDLLILYSINEIDLTEGQKNKIKEYLETIMKESLNHKQLFIGLIDYVLANGENNY